VPVGDDSSLLGRNACIIATFYDKFRRDGKFYQSRFGQSRTDCVSSLRHNVAVLSAAGLSPWHLSGFSPLVIRKPQQYKSHPMRPVFPRPIQDPKGPRVLPAVSRTQNYIQIKDTRRLSTLLGAERPATTLPVVIMRSLRPFIMLPSILYATQVSLALHIEFSRSSGARLSNLLTRAPNATSTLDKNYGGYNINITLGGKQFSVMVDTGRYALYPYRLISALNISPHSYWYKTLVQTFGYRGRYPMPSIWELLLKSITTSAQLKVSVFCFFHRVM
jgi:hypothetical protein